jgi:DnaJ-class molecular chaperone
MAECYKLYKSCNTCDGTGTVPLPIGTTPVITQVVCPICAGAKVLFDGYCTVATYPISEVPD